MDGERRAPKADMQSIWMAATRAEAHAALIVFVSIYAAKYPKGRFINASVNVVHPRNRGKQTQSDPALPFT